MTNESQAFPCGIPLGKLIGLVNHHKERLLHHYLMPLDMTPAQFKVLAAIAFDGANSPAEISKLLSIDCGSMTRMIERLVKKSLIEKQPNPEDKRGVLLHLTTTGQSLLEECLEIINNHVSPLLIGDLSSDEVDQLTGLLKRLLP
ncbi:MarR family transcriptional regulator [Vibrio rumoiensis]|uniref:Transcriptional regulator n=1 Tax=Vibrio rumoiensis 1S-45 TaxID=1188252 RepID=A0A1E5E516_9VIBR|nr:MarR family transcriptional regulator [Vibrio rumoiensis]OEF28435.1 transcriptional regulator [Vibrio rumoiensis 1S-45]